MNIYEQYATTKAKIKELTALVKQLEPKILEEVHALSAPMKTDQGTFSKVVTTKWAYSNNVVKSEEKLHKLVSSLRDNFGIAELKAKEVKEGTATSTETVGLRFRAS